MVIGGVVRREMAIRAWSHKTGVVTEIAAFMGGRGHRKAWLYGGVVTEEGVVIGGVVIGVGAGITG